MRFSLRLPDALSDGDTAMKPSSRLTPILFCLLFFLHPTAAHADMGSPILFAVPIHLFIVNILIGILEGSLIAKIFKTPLGNTNRIMILGNFFSALIGYVLLFTCVYPIRDALHGADPIYNAGRSLLVPIICSWALSVFIEWPFVARAMQNEPGRWRSSLWGSLIAQTAS